MNYYAIKRKKLHKNKKVVDFYAKSGMIEYAHP